MNTNAKKQQVSPWALNLSNFRALKQDRRDKEIEPKGFSGKERRSNDKSVPTTTTNNNK